MIKRDSKHFVILCLVLSIVVLSCNKNEQELEEPFSVVLFDSDYSLAYALIYELNINEIKITYSGGVEGEADSVIYQKQLSSEEKRNVVAFFSDFPLTKLKDKYIEPNVADGDQKLFEFVIGDIRRQIQTSNYYQDDLGELVGFLNTLITDKYKINYMGISP